MKKSTENNKESNQKTVKLTKKQNIVQTVKFVLFSASAGIIQTVTFTLINELGSLPYWPSYLTALVLSVLYNFTLNRKFTFKSANNVPLAMLKVAGYYAVFTPLSTLWGEALTRIGWNEYLVLFPTMLVNLITEFLFTRFVVYRNSINTNTYSHKEGGVGGLAKAFFSKLNYIVRDPKKEEMLDELCLTLDKGGAAFIGDGTTLLFASYFPDRRVYNLGISGDTTDGVLSRLAKHLDALAPKKVFVQIGANDLASGQDAAYVQDNVANIIGTIQSKLPNTKIYLLSLLPANSRVLLGRSNESIAATNALLQELSSESVIYVDLYSAFIDTRGNLSSDLSANGLHPGHKGCMKLREILLPFLDES